MSQLKVTQIKSLIGAKPKVRESVRSLGLKRIHHSVVIADTQQMRGYLHAARHMLVVEEVAAADASAAGANKK